MLADLLIVLGGALAILLVAEIVIRLTLRLARHYGLSGSFVGLTVLSIGTSLLEIMTHIVGSMRILREPETMDTLSGLLLGSNIGSDIFQQNFVLPLVGLIGTVAIARRMLTTEVGALIAASSLLWFACLGGVVTRLEGGLLVLAYLAYLYYLGRVRHDISAMYCFVPRFFRTIFENRNECVMESTPLAFAHRHVERTHRRIRQQNLDPVRGAAPLFARLRREHASAGVAPDVHDCFLERKLLPGRSLMAWRTAVAPRLRRGHGGPRQQPGQEACHESRAVHQRSR